jgi:hypothetical protein
MLNNESQVRQAFTAAGTKLEAALTEYAAARKKLHAITGEFAGTDHKITMKFRSLDADGAAGANAAAEIILTDC